MCFNALPRQVFEALFLFEQISDWLRPCLDWELLEENILTIFQFTSAQALETVVEGGDRLTLTHPEAE